MTLYPPPSMSGWSHGSEAGGTMMSNTPGSQA
jgi:hypothetical protein